MTNFYNPYMMQGNYLQELNNMRDRIENQIQQIQQQGIVQPQMQQPTNLTQNFQLAPTNTSNNFKLVDNLEDVKKEVIIIDTYFLAKDNSSMWIKNTKGDIRTFTITEIIPKDDKDILIENLQKQLNELKGGKTNEYNESSNELLYEQSNAAVNNSIGTPITTNESSNVSIIPNGKTAKRKP